MTHNVKCYKVVAFGSDSLNHNFINMMLCVVSFYKLNIVGISIYYFSADYC